MKKLWIGIGILAVLVLVTWAVCETAHSDYYNYRGYITDIGRNEKGEIILTTLSGQGESVFTVKWYTKKSAPQKQEFAPGDRILLTTTRNSSENIKKLKISPGYSTEGKLVYMENLISPFLLGTDKETGEKYLICLITHDEALLADRKAGDTVKVYHEYPANMTVSIDAAVLIAEGSAEAITAEEIDFITSQGYTVASPAP